MEAMEKDDKSALKSFLDNAGVPREALLNKFLDEGITLEILLQANDNELSCVVPNIADKIKIRTALDQYRNNRTEGPPVLVALPERQGPVYLVPQHGNEYAEVEVPSTSSGITPRPGLTEGQLTSKSSLPSLDFSLDLELFQNYQLPLHQTQKSLRLLLSSETYGRNLLEASGKESLSPRDRAYIVKLVVETELKSLEKINNTIRKEVWMHWANEISQLFKQENSDLYYVPYHIVGNKIIQASGLIHNRLITHRRSLAPEGLKRKCSTNSSDSSKCSSKSDSIKRVRPLPDDFKIAAANDLLTGDEYDDDNADCNNESSLDWLQNSSSPSEIVFAKWQATFDLRIKLLESSTCMEYFNLFPALQLPDGYKLLTSDFEVVNSSANKTFAEKFPLIKARLLQLLAEKTGSAKAEEARSELVKLASGENLTSWPRQDVKLLTNHGR